MKRIAVIILLLFTVMIPITVVHASTNEDKVSVGGDVNIDKDTAGTVVAVGGDVTIDKDIDGSVVAVFGDVKVNAKVSGDVVSVLGKVKLTDKAEVRGSLISIGKLDRADKARINGENVIISTGDIDIGDFHMEYSELMSLISLR
jgi:cytoskeletal protein CcmA (bactofilin family)